jgi:hypothetical protein
MDRAGVPRRMLIALAMAASLAGVPWALAAGQMIDLQVSLCGAPDQVQQALQLRRHGAPTQVWLFDDTGLSLLGRGLRLRLRGPAGEANELTLKAAEQDCGKLPALPSGEGKCEFDRHGEKIGSSLSLTTQLPPQRAAALVAGQLPLAEALSPAQADLLRRLPGAWPLPAGLRALGPTQVTSYRTRDKAYAVDISELPGGERFIEISRKVALADASRAQARFDADLAKAGVAVCADQSAQAANKLRALLAHRP